LPNNDLEKIVSKKENLFWIENNYKFFEIYRQITTGAVCIILDRASDTQEWVRNFVISATHAGVDRSDIKVCFRESDLNKKNRFNEWIKEQGLGGSVDTGRIFIFDSKPAKWLFAKELDVKLIVTNNLYPNTNTMTQQWIEHHPCVLYVGDIKPSQKRNIKIVQL
jgi:histone deacetylase complex regulatory component SIN3